MAKELYRQDRHLNQRGTLGPRTETGGAGYFGWIAQYERPLLVRNQRVLVKEEEPKKK
ncbi:MAG: hypothetical protein PHD04_00275 [Candidatus Pacebacteria bacterium]|nr:hypothetical protein [Candidatus Paceibacterota bacterium]